MPATVCARAVLPLQLAMMEWGCMNWSPRTSQRGASARRSSQLAALRSAVLESPGRTGPALRLAAASGGPVAEPLGSYLSKVRDQSYRITGTDFETLSAAGLGEDEIFELTVAAALGAALRSFDAGMRALTGDV